VWCAKCGIGTPANHIPALIANVETGHDAIPDAIARWNVYAKGVSSGA